MTDNSWSQTEFEETCVHFRDRAREVFESDGYHHIMAFLFATRDPKTSEGTKAIVCVIPEKFGVEDKDGYSKYIHKAAEATRSVGLILVTEMWMLKDAKGEDEVEKWRGRLHEHPDRVEAIMFSTEHARYGSKLWMAEITRDPEGKPTLSAWALSPAKQSRGRFVGLLPLTS